MTRVILTVGTNPVPVLVAAYRLAKHFHKPDTSPVELVLLHTADTGKMADAVKTVLEAKLNAEFDPPLPTVQPEEIEGDSDPAAVYRKVTALATGAAEHYHLHYTGGRKSMGIKAMQALIDVAGTSNVSDSYLDVNTHVLLDDTGQFTGVDDERKSWNLDLRQLLELHDYSLDFLLRQRERSDDGTYRNVDASFGNFVPRAGIHHDNKGSQPPQGWVDIAISVFDVLNNPTWGRSFSQWDKRKKYLAIHKWPRYPDPSANPPKVVCWSDAIPTGLDNTDPSITKWAAQVAAMNRFFDDSPWNDDGVLNPSRLSPPNLELITDLLNNSWLELAVFHYFRSALMQRSGPFNIYYSFHPTRTPRGSNLRVTRQFEVDVLAVLGYQAVLVSCTASSDDNVKTKGFEALHRVHQIGGDGARAIVLCGMHGGVAKPLEEELHHETGEFGRALRIWSREEWKDLKRAFERYLDEIGWR